MTEDIGATRAEPTASRPARPSQIRDARGVMRSVDVEAVQRSLPRKPTSAAGMVDFRISMCRAWAFPGYFANAPLPPKSAQMWEWPAAALSCRGDLWWVGADAAAVVSELAVGVPADTSYADELLPFAGLAFFEGAFDRQHFGETQMDLSAISWVRCRDDDGTAGWSACLYGWAFNEEEESDFLWPFSQQYWLNDETLGQTDQSENPSPFRDENPFRWLLAMIALSKEPRLASSADVPPPRPAARRSRRAGLDPGSTRVIYLRGSSASTGEGTGREHHHRWVVSGHWRSQPYGEGRKLRRPVYIAPHIKGPEGAPLLHGEKVRAVVR